MKNITNSHALMQAFNDLKSEVNSLKKELNDHLALNYSKPNKFKKELSKTLDPLASTLLEQSFVVKVIEQLDSLVPEELKAQLLDQHVPVNQNNQQKPYVPPVVNNQSEHESPAYNNFQVIVGKIARLSDREVTVGQHNYTGDISNAIRRFNLRVGMDVVIKLHRDRSFSILPSR